MEKEQSSASEPAAENTEIMREVLTRGLLVVGLSSRPVRLVTTLV